MKCINCNADIPPAFVHALQSNSCPGCGGQIMDQAGQELLTELKDAMEKMPNDPAGLAGWLLSNYSLRKIGTAEPTEFYGKVKKTNRSGGHIDENRIKINENNPVQKFLKRAGLPSQAEKQQKLKSIADMINNGEIDDSALYGDNEVEENFDVDEEQEFDHSESFAKKAFNNQLVVGSDGRPISKEDVASLVAAVGDIIPDAEAGHQALQEARMERLRKQRDMVSGIGGGSFRRGG